MSSLRILFYGKLVDLLGRELEIEWPQHGGSVGVVRERLAALYPHAGDALLTPSLRACIGDALVDEGQCVRSGDTIEFFPPVSGG